MTGETPGADSDRPSVAYEQFGVTVHHGDCLDVLRAIPAESVHAVVTDPPYELAFMGKTWDGSGIAFNVDVWRECLRVLKPGGHLLAFGGSRTWHRLAVAIEDAGFEMRDSIAWLYGSGFPKSMDVSKAIDKAAVAMPLWDEVRAHLRHWKSVRGMSNAALNAAVGGAVNGGGRASAWLSDEQRKPELPSKAQWARLRDALAWDRCPLDDIYDEIKDGASRPTIGTRSATRAGGSWAEHENAGMFRRGTVDYDITAPATPAAQQWSGWGTALKPAFEPIVVARKPLSGTVAANVLEYGTGALNIDACRVPHVTVNRGNLADNPHLRTDLRSGSERDVYGKYSGAETPASPDGRWPTNVVLDVFCGGELDEQSGTLKSGANPTRRSSDKFRDAYGEFKGQEVCTPARGADSGGASRFFPVFGADEDDHGDECPDCRWENDHPPFRYQAKAPTRERPVVTHDDGTKTAHPTVKPLALMRWLVRLVTPAGGTVLDPFLGSGTTAQAARDEGFRCIGIESYEPYIDLIRARLDARLQQSTPEAKGAPEVLDLLDLLTEDGAA